MADGEGRFSVETDLRTVLNLKIDMTGFSSTDIIIESGAKNIDIGMVYLDEGTLLDEVTVSANQVINAKGRTIIYPSAADVKASSTSIGLFQKLPLPGLQANPTPER